MALDPALATVARRARSTLDHMGPMLGSELCEQLADVPKVAVWKACLKSDFVYRTAFGRYYLRYDITRDDGIRLTPSILRDFLTYTLLYTENALPSVMELTAERLNALRIVSQRKLAFARQLFLTAPGDVVAALRDTCCAYIAGDIAYNLAHDVPRKHVETGVTVHGSDIDLVLVHNHKADTDAVEAMEAHLLKTKHRYLMDPGVREELDFVVKPVSRMIDQFAYDDIPSKIACKVLYESQYVFGDVGIYDALLANLKLSGVTAKIEADFATALSSRKDTYAHLLEVADVANPLDPDTASLFYFSQERVEME